MPDTAKHLLLVEDEAPLREAIAEQLRDRGYLVEQAASGEMALDRLAGFAYDILVSDLRLPGLDGSGVVEAAVARYPDIIAVVVTGFGTVKDAVDAIKRGAWDFVSKPFHIDELVHVLDAALEHRRLRSENAYLRAQLEDRYRFEGVVGKGRAMAHLFQLLESVAPTNSTILITGETGTGKEVVARAIHHGGPRRLHRFVALNCSAIPETLLEAELFGHVRGAFTGAVGNRQGRLEQAHKGTLFLDEVGTMSAALQMKLLRVLQEREFERVGDSKTIRVDVRVVAATNESLEDEIEAGRFREDLYYRLNVVPIPLPPLRERRDDIPLLAQFFLKRYGELNRRDVPELTPQLTQALLAYDWPGNVRELENTIERLVVLSDGKTFSSTLLKFGRPKYSLRSARPRTDDVPGLVRKLVEVGVRTPPPDGSKLYDFLVGGVERELIEQVMRQCDEVKVTAADRLGINRNTLHKKLEQYAAANGALLTDEVVAETHDQ
jgi:DNA-binding NtrC family response regulator